ncbi:MAG: NUDIX hydrolase [Xanthobacteraceae bacterium]
MQNIDIIKLAGVEIKVEPWAWDYAIDNRRAIEQHFVGLQHQRPALWNGRVLLLHRWSVDRGVMRGCCFETDYASLTAWRDWDFPDPAVHNFFAAAALRTADGAYLVGEMAASTAGAGQLYFPCGTPEPSDVADRDRVDVAANLARELREETGLHLEEFEFEPGWTMVRDRGYVALIKEIAVADDADTLRSRIMRYLAAETDPELSAIYVLRGPTDVDGRIPRHVTRFLETRWA